MFKWFWTIFSLGAPLNWRWRDILWGFSLLLSVLPAKFGPSLIKCLLHWSAISSLLVYILLFLAILRGVVWLFVFLFISCWFQDSFLYGACFSTINLIASIARAVTSCKSLHCSVIAFQSIVWISWRYDSLLKGLVHDNAHVWVLTVADCF